MFAQFPVWSTPILAAKELWEKIVLPNDIVIDATCGNGNDTVTLAQLVPEGKVWAFDIQKEAVDNTLLKLKQDNLTHRVEIRQISHAHFPVEVFPESIRLIVYNLGYLPGSGKKEITTLMTSTLESIQNALPLLKPGGALSITIYPGHSEGARELTALMEFSQQLTPSLWMATHLRWINRENSPSLLWISKALRA